MVKHQYKEQHLKSVLENLRSNLASGTLQLEIKIETQQKVKNCIIVWQNGEITYAGDRIPSDLELLKKIGQKFKPDVIDAAIDLAKKKATNPESIRELADWLVKMRVLTWEQIEAIVRYQVITILEQALPQAGEFEFKPTVEFDLSYGENSHGLDWSKLMQDIDRRQQEWAAFAPVISSMYAVPHITTASMQKITEPAVRQHLQLWVDGKRSLVDIAEKLDKDPLNLAPSYLNWAKLEWLFFKSIPVVENKILPVNNKPVETKERQVILSVDDSPVVQTTIKRALADRYNVLLASNAIDALSIMNQKDIRLLLLDVTMPGVDGLEMCRTVRSIPKFRDLPIVMLTARDGFVDKIKGQIAGSTQYLTKPFHNDKLIEIVEKYVK
jgi:twitching motility two-component system response regulator PilG